MGAAAGAAAEEPEAPDPPPRAPARPIPHPSGARINDAPTPPTPPLRPQRGSPAAGPRPARGAASPAAAPCSPRRRPLSPRQGSPRAGDAEAPGEGRCGRCWARTGRCVTRHQRDLILLAVFSVGVTVLHCLAAYYCCWFVVISRMPASWGWHCQPPDHSGSKCSSPGDCKGRLRIRNGCDTQPIWIANQGYKTAYLAPQMVKLLPGELVAFPIPARGLASTRFWPLADCDGDNKCQIGQSVGSTNGLPPCDEAGCAPPVDSKFEATWGCALSEADCGHIPAETGGGTLKGDDYFDVSLVDGFTLPYSLEFEGGCRPENRLHKHVTEWEAKDLDFETMCPHTESLDRGSPVDLRVYHPGSNKVVGCSSPCSRLTIPNWQTRPFHFANAAPEAVYYCCPAGSLGPGQETPRKCEAGPVSSTDFVRNVHCYAPDVYAYSYDDANANFRCPPDTIYTMTFYCPPKSGGRPPLTCTPAPPTPGPPSTPSPGPAPPPPPGPCTLKPSDPCTAAACCNPKADPPAFCPGAVPCCDCGAPSCACPGLPAAEPRLRVAQPDP
eukprot:TRINITY_DN65432_c0_g1_i1.p1 TRINITY_DN65432_c0_g1~~TRINITY_DN65432_c0_g1_i1.p1  ORF type:complete len:554 (+),score=65.71 TRINITY_DN65432_c0_g1_i1:90-1751(+)